jgi:hypothetical protein
MDVENVEYALLTPKTGVESASPEAKTGTAPTDAQADTTSATEPVPKTFTQAELDAIVQKRVAKAEAKAARRVDELHRATLQHLAPQQRATPDAEISRDDYKTDAEWIDAKVEARLAARDAQNQTAQQQREANALVQTTEKLYAEAEKIDGFDRDAFDDLPITPMMATAIMDSDTAPKLMAHLAANPAEVDRIAKLSHARQASEIGKLEQTLSAAPRSSKAGAPISPVSNGRTNVGAVESMSPEDFYANRQKQGGRYYNR